MFRQLNVTLHKLILSKLAYAIWTSFKHSPDDWEDYENDFRVRHKLNKIKIWTGNGRWFFNIEHENSHDNSSLLGLFDRHLVWLAFKSAKRRNKRLNKTSVADVYLKMFTSSKNG